MDTHTYQVLHSRPPVEVKAPNTITALVFLVNIQKNNLGDYVDIEYIETLIETVYKHYKHPLPTSNQDRLYERFACQQTIPTEKNEPVMCVLQKHTSFFYIAFFSNHTNEEDSLLWSAIPYNLSRELFEESAFKTHIRVEKDDPNEKDYSYILEKTFNFGFNEDSKSRVNNIYTELFGSIVSDGGAVVWTPFRRFDDGFNRILIRDISLRPARLGRLVRRLAEIDMYVTLGGGNFHVAQEQLKEFIQHEQTLKKIIENDSHDNAITDRELFEDLTSTSRKVSQLVAETRYGFQATVAYSELVWQRIFELREQRLEGWTRIGFFLERTFRPCVRTCESALRYQLAVSQGIEEAASLLGARLSLKVQEEVAQRTDETKNILKKLQNLSANSGKILDEQQKNEKRMKSFRLAVEFLAIFPIAYYVSSAIYHISYVEKSWILSFPLLVICLFILLFLPIGRRIREWAWTKLGIDG